MDAIELLEQQHEEVKNLFELISEAEGLQAKRALTQDLADALSAHAAIEEELFYPAAYAKATKKLLTEAVEEHLSMKRILVDVLEMSPDHENFEAKLDVLEEQIDHHVEEEEGDLFRKVREEMSAKDLERLGLEMKDRFDELMSGQPSERVFSETDEAAHLPS